MSAHVLLNLSNQFGKRDKMQGLPSILSLFHIEFNIFNNTRARILDSIYHMTLMPRSHIHGSPRRFHYGSNPKDDPGNDNFRSPIQYYNI